MKQTVCAYWGFHEKGPTATCALRDRYIVSIEWVYTSSNFYMKSAVYTYVGVKHCVYFAEAGTWRGAATNARQTWRIIRRVYTSENPFLFSSDFSIKFNPTILKNYYCILNKKKFVSQAAIFFIIISWEPGIRTRGLQYRTSFLKRFFGTAEYLFKEDV